MPASADDYTASADDYSTSTDYHCNPSSGHDYSYSSSPDGNREGHCDPANTNNDGDSMDDSDSGAGS